MEFAANSAAGPDHAVGTGQRLPVPHRAEEELRDMSASDPRRQPAPGYPNENPRPKRQPPKAPGEGRPDEPQNDPDRKPGRGNG